MNNTVKELGRIYSKDGKTLINTIYCGNGQVISINHQNNKMSMVKDTPEHMLGETRRVCKNIGLKFVDSHMSNI